MKEKYSIKRERKMKPTKNNKKGNYEKNLLLFGKSLNGLDPPPLLYFWIPLRNLKKKLFLDKLKFIKIFGF